MRDNKVRLQKFIASCGIASRRRAEELIEQGKVKVNGHIAVLGMKVDPIRDKVMVSGKRVIAQTNKVYIMLHKPRGYVTTMSDEMGRKTVSDLVKDIPERVFPVGRLDRDSEGLIFMTNDGEFANILTHPSRHVNKTYRVTVRDSVSEEQIVEMETGIMLDGSKTQPCEIWIMERGEGRTVLGFTIHEGRNRQIRRMCEAVGLEVIRLKRVEIAGVKLGMLQPGKWRTLNEKEMQRLNNISQNKKEA